MSEDDLTLMGNVETCLIVSKSVIHKSFILLAHTHFKHQVFWTTRNNISLTILNCKSSKNFTKSTRNLLQKLLFSVFKFKSAKWQKQSQGKLPTN